MHLIRINHLLVSAGTSLKDKRGKVFDGKREKAADRSPINFADRVRAPLLIVHGAHDRNVKVVHSDEMVTALRRAGKCAHYIYYPDEAHRFRRPANAGDFAQRVELFLARHLCGHMESTEKIPTSSAQIR